MSHHQYQRPSRWPRRPLGGRAGQQAAPSHHCSYSEGESRNESLQHKGVDEIGCDQPLDSVVITRPGGSYYERDMILLPAVDPSDTLVSRLAREMEKLNLTLRDVWDTRTQEFQRMQSAERINVSTSGETPVDVVQNQPKDESVERTVATYLSKHVTLMVAYAEAGSTPITPPTGSLPRSTSHPLSSISSWRTTSRSSQRPKSCQHLWHLGRATEEFHVDAWFYHPARVEKRDQAWDPPEKGSIIINNYVLE